MREIPREIIRFFGAQRYAIVGTVYSTLVETFGITPSDVLDGLGITPGVDDDTPRTGIDQSVTVAGHTFHFVGTPDHGDWLVVTSAE